MNNSLAGETSQDAIVVFTSASASRLIDQGGSRAWVLDRTRAKQCKWLVCTANQRGLDPAYPDVTEPHGTAFLLAKISGFRPAPKDGKGRWMITFSEYALINHPNAWGGWRNPVRYT